MGGMLRRAVLTFGPVLSVVWVASLAADGTMPAVWFVPVAGTVLTVAWSPLFFSVPALLTQDARDAALPGVRGVRRAVLLMPALLGATPEVRTDQLTALAGLAAGIAVTVVHAAAI